MKTGEANGGVEAGAASRRASLAGEVLFVEEVTDIASSAGGLIASEGVLVESAYAAGSRAQHTETVGQDETSQAVNADRVGTRTGLDAGPAIFTAGRVGADLAANSRNAERISRRARGAEGRCAAGDARECAIGASIIGCVEICTSKTSSTVVGLADITIHAVGAARSADTELGVGGTSCHEVKSRDADCAGAGVVLGA